MGFLFACKEENSVQRGEQDELNRAEGMKGAVKEWVLKEWEEKEKEKEKEKESTQSLHLVKTSQK